MESMITEIAFVNLYAAHDTVNHIILIQKLSNTTHVTALCRVIQNLLSNIIFYVELNNERSRWRLQGSVLSPTLFYIYTNDQPLNDGIRRYINTDDLFITAQYPTFSRVESTTEEALGAPNDTAYKW